MVFSQMRTFRISLIEGLLLAVALIWAANFSVVKASLPFIDPMSFNAMRFGISIVLMVGILIWKGGYKPVPLRDVPALFALGLLGNTAYQLFFIFGLNLTHSANASVMLGTIPVWVALVSHFFFDEKMTRGRFFGVSLTFGGILLILTGSGKELSFGSGTLYGDMLTLASALVFGTYTVLSKDFLKRYPPLQLTVMSMVSGGGVLVLAAIPDLIVLDYASIPMGAWLGVTYSGLLSVGLAYIIWNYALNQVGAVRTATYQNLVPVLGLLIGFFLMGEPLAALQMMGSLVVIGGIIVTRKG
jgi:drug/metabolite transporter (DMT)-like permease